MKERKTLIRPTVQQRAEEGHLVRLHYEHAGFAQTDQPVLAPMVSEPERVAAVGQKLRTDT